MPAGFRAESANDLAARPNVAIIFFDDMSWSDLTCFGGN